MFLSRYSFDCISISLESVRLNANNSSSREVPSWEVVSEANNSFAGAAAEQINRTLASYKTSINVINLLRGALFSGLNFGIFSRIINVKFEANPI